jgi:hypothetical protein
MEPATLRSERRDSGVKREETAATWVLLGENSKAADIQRFSIFGKDNSGISALSGQWVPQGVFAVSGEIQRF